MRILGMDIGRGNIVACLLSDRPQNPRQAYHSCQFYHIENNAEGVGLLQSLSPDIAVGEPTGIKYLKFWERWLLNMGCELWLISNQALAPYRKFLDLPDKDDQADSLALACYWFDYGDNPRRFLSRRNPIVAEIRDLAMRRTSYEKEVGRLVNICHQDLVDEFPEVYRVKSSRKILKSPPLFWRWLAGEENGNYDELYLETYGKGLSVHTEFNAQLICLIGEHEKLIENRIEQLLLLRQFQKYLMAAEDLELGLTTEAIVISQIFPIEKFFGSDGKPEIINVVGKESGKPQTYDLSLRRFRKILGVVPTRNWSGTKRSYGKGGNIIAKTALWQWAMTRIVPEHSCLKTPIGEKLRGIYVQEKAEGKPGSKVIRKICAKAIEYFYRELLKH